MIDLYTAGTPNGHKASVALEEMQLAYSVHALQLGELQQKQAWYLKINPNGRIPAIVDRCERGQGDFTVFESGAILIYLAEKTGQFLPVNAKARSEVIQWLMFQMGGVGPMQGQANVFQHYAPERIQYGIERYVNETRRLYEVLEDQLAASEYLAGDYSIADMATYPWVAMHKWSGIPMDGLDNVQRWLKLVGQRPAVHAGMEIPKERPDKEDKKSVEEAEKMARNMLV